MNKKVFLVILSVLMLSFLSSGFAAPYGDLQIVNNTLSDSSGRPVQLRGWSQLDLMQADTAWVVGATIPNLKALCPGLNAVRIAMYTSENGHGYMDQNTAGRTNYRNRVKDLIRDAINANLYALVDWHILNDADPWSSAYAAEAKSFFIDIAQTFNGSDNLLFELCNEPKQVSFTGVIKPYAEGVLAGIRQYSDNIVVVGTPTWSQDVDQVVGNKITNNLGRGVMYSLHFYAATHYQYLRDKGNTALNGGVPVMLSEWGTVSSSGDGSTDYNNSGAWLDWAQQKNISWFNWSWSIRKETSAAIANGSLSGPWSYPNNLTASGQWVYQRINSGPTPPPAATMTPTRTSTLTATQTATNSVRRGDTNNDGTVNIIDALLVAQYSVGLVNSNNINTAAADTNCDGTINIIDALIIAQFYVGLVTSFC